MREGRRWRVTGIGWVVIVLFVAGVVLVTFAHGMARFVGGLVAVLLLVMFARDPFRGHPIDDRGASWPGQRG
jgi:hypothetical protein